MRGAQQQTRYKPAEVTLSAYLQALSAGETTIEAARQDLALKPLFAPALVFSSLDKKLKGYISLCDMMQFAK